MDFQLAPLCFYLIILIIIVCKLDTNIHYMLTSPSVQWMTLVVRLSFSPASTLIFFHCSIVPLYFMSTSDLHLEKAQSPILVTLSGTFTELKERAKCRARAYC